MTPLEGDPDFLTPEERARLEEGVVLRCPLHGMVSAAWDDGTCWTCRGVLIPYLPQETAHYFARLLADSRRDSWERDTT